MIRRMLPSDVDASAWMAFEAGNGTAKDWADRFNRDVENERHFPVVAVDSANKVVGYARTCWHQAEQAREDAAPTGWYLMGLRVEASSRRQGVGAKLTSARLDWLSGRTENAYCLVSSHNVPSRELHEQMGFSSHGSDFTFPGLEMGHEELLFSIDLPVRQ